ncbi:A/G-specific adenine glycosylase [Desulfovibrio desulfuricans]|uniref:Adenine DNA glycosylase n=1 Tax=Desulfovibrio desulfuricans TaxID=876 RepID=A0A4P7UPR5_DESDE|nr:A/G-specific adenine glycosylase [Desulfovibrio desulfuricans]QCC86891.1 A/G-specific adenine glycosylase [Desulfovibrio desulfuricans]
MNRKLAKPQPAALPGLPIKDDIQPDHLPPQNHRAELQQALLHWFAQNQRSLPWRANYTPYEVWISEVMLQQTQMERGVSYFNSWMRRFPDIASLAAASEEEVLRQWEGLGYYSRARYILKAARKIMTEHDGVFPSDLAAIRALPGVGPYTAGAVASIAFGEKLPCVDANVERVIARVFDVDSPVKQDPAAGVIHRWALRLVPEGLAREHNQAMMELGALVCRKKPRCGVCPLARYCISLHLGITDQRPVPGKRAAITPVLAVTGVLRCGDRVFVQKRPPSGVWGNLWEFPGGRVEADESADQAAVREFMEETGFAVRVAQRYGIIRHGYTTYRLTLHCFGLELAAGAETPPKPPLLSAATEARWVAPQELNDLAMPAAHRKLADKLFGAPDAEGAAEPQQAPLPSEPLQ